MTHAIFLSFDDRYGSYAVACMNSIHTNYPGHPPILAHYDGEQPGVLAVLNKVDAELLKTPSEVRDIFAAAPTGPVGSPMVYDRFQLWGEDFSAYQNILHLDVDTLVLKPLDDLINSPVFVAQANHESTADVRVFIPEMTNDPALRALLEEDGLEYPGAMDDMINAGVMLIPPAARCSRQYQLLQSLYGRYRPYLQYADQSLLSLWCAINDFQPGHDFEYNFQTPFFTDSGIDISLDDVYILHFSSERKPLTTAFRNWDRLGDAAPRCEELFRHFLELDD